MSRLGLVPTGVDLEAALRLGLVETGVELDELGTFWPKVDVKASLPYPTPKRSGSQAFIYP